MGVLGLRKFVDSSGCTRLLKWPQDGGEPVDADHVFLDMNGLIHACYARDHTAPAHTINAVLQRLERLLRGVVRPTRTLLLAVDGPAPMMKLATQRIRRRKQQHMDVANSAQFSDLAITVGSVFLLQLEQAAARFLLQARKDGWLRAVNCVVVGSAVAGEGEHKISQALAHLAPAQQRLSNDSVVVVGNDIDLVLTCVAATAFHNMYVLSPSSLQLTDVGAMLQRWVPAHPDSFVPTRRLPSARLDFVFLFQLNGGDHYDGLGDAAAALWRRYKVLRSAMPDSFRLVRPATMEIDVQALFELLGCQGPAAAAPAAAPAPAGTGGAGGTGAELGLALLRAAAWELAVCVTGDPVDFQHDCGDASGATLAMVRSAVVGAPGGTVRVAALTERPPLSPLQAFIALMPTRDALPAAAQRAALKRPDEWRQLETAREPGAVFRATKAFFRTVALDELSPAERFLTQFGAAVDVSGSWWNDPRPRDVLPGMARPRWGSIFAPKTEQAAGAGAGVGSEAPAATPGGGGGGRKGKAKKGEGRKGKAKRPREAEPATLQDAVRAHIASQRKAR